MSRQGLQMLGSLLAAAVIVIVVVLVVSAQIGPNGLSGRGGGEDHSGRH